MAVIDFALIGAPCSGTRALADMMRRHPQLSLPVGKSAPVLLAERRYVFGPEVFEPGFFAEKGEDAKRGLVSPGRLAH
jgi:hypothetical protein